MGYTTNENMVRVDFFKSTGKWYTTEAVECSGVWALTGASIQSSFAGALVRHLGTRLTGMVAVCVDHPQGVPIMMEVDRAHAIWQKAAT